MSNMSYCRFQNTANDLSDCLAHIDDELSKDEERARKWLISMCRQVADWFAEDEEEEEDEQ